MKNRLGNEGEKGSVKVKRQILGEPDKVRFFFITLIVWVGVVGEGT